MIPLVAQVCVGCGQILDLASTTCPMGSTSMTYSSKTAGAGGTGSTRQVTRYWKG